MPVSTFQLHANPRKMSGDDLGHGLQAGLLMSLERAAGDEKKIRDAVFQFACRARAAALAPGAIAYVLGMSMAESPLTLAERAAALRFFPCCDELAAEAERRAAAEPQWWQWRRLGVWRPHDVGQQFI